MNLRLLLPGCLLFMAGCGGFFDSDLPAPKTYILAPTAPQEATATVAADLSIARPTTTPGLDTPRIAVLRQGNELDYYAAAQWGGSASDVIQAFLVAALQQSGGFRSVTSEQARVSADYLLDLDLRDFQAEYAADDTAPAVRVTVMASLIRIKDRRLVGLVPVSAVVTASDNRLGAVVVAFQSATQQVAADLSRQTAALVRE